MALLDNKTALVTGATRGIGRGIALKLAESGANIAFTYLSSVEKAQILEDEIKALGVKVKGFKSDASSKEDAEALINNVVDEFETIDILVNNAGITKDNLVLRLSEEDFDHVLNTNLKSVFHLTKLVSKPMMKQKKGSIINISSIVGLTGNPGQSNYAASKAGVIGFSKSVSKELSKRNIRINVVAPGFINTEMTDKLDDSVKNVFMQKIPMNRYGNTDEVANVVLFFASDLSSYVTGQTLTVCGGMFD
jgi:3-oxoacyl-[acyl-carrier protein] reductase